MPWIGGECAAVVKDGALQIAPVAQRVREVHVREGVARRKPRSFFFTADYLYEDRVECVADRVACCTSVDLADGLRENDALGHGAVSAAQDLDRSAHTD